MNGQPTLRVQALGSPSLPINTRFKDTAPRGDGGNQQRARKTEQKFPTYDPFCGLLFPASLARPSFGRQTDIQRTSINIEVNNGIKNTS